MNAIKGGTLTGFRDNRNRWQIKPEDLSKWLTERTDSTTVTNDNSDTLKLPSINEHTLRIAVLKAELENRDQRISDLERDRDDWKSQAQELARRSTHDVQIAPSPRRRWWPLG